VPDVVPDVAPDVVPDVVANNPPVAVISQSPSPVPAGASVTLSGTSSYDPDPGDTVVSYAWSWTVAGVPQTSTSSSISFVVPCSSAVVVSLVVTDNHGLTSTSTQHSVVVQDVLGSWVSIDGCTAGDECGTVQRPWCSMTAAYERWPQILADGSTHLRVVRGRYEQGTTHKGGVAIASPGESLVWNDTTAATDPRVEAYASLGGSALSAATCDQWDTSPAGVAVVTHEAAGWQLTANADVDLQKLCVVARPSSVTALPLVSALTSTGNASRFVDGIVRTDTISTPLPARAFGVWYSGSVPAGLLARFENSAVIAGSATDESGGVLVGPSPMLPVLFTGTVRLDGATVSFGNASASMATFGVLSGGDVTEVLSSTLSGGPGTDESYGIYVEGQDSLSVSESLVHGRGTGVSMGIFSNMVGAVTLDGSHIYGYPDASGPVTVRRATGVHVRNGATVDLRALGAGYPDLDIEGAGAGVTASHAARGIHVETLQSGGQPGVLTLTGPATGTLVRVRGGDSTLLSSGIETDSGISLKVTHVSRITGGRVTGPAPGVTPVQSVAAGVRLRGLNGEAELEGVGLIQGCEPACVDQGVSLGATPSDESGLLGVGLFVDANATTWPPTAGAWKVHVQGSSTIYGGDVSLAASVANPTAELVGIRAFGDYATGHGLTLDGGIRIRGSSATSATHLPSRSAGIRLARSSVDAVAPLEVIGGPARVVSRGVWMTRANPSGAAVPARGAAFRANGTDTDSLSISGNPESGTGLRPGSVYGIQDISSTTAALANVLAVAAYPPTDSLGWSTVEGGWAAPNMQGTAVGVSLRGTSGAILDHVRVHGGVVPGGLVQHGLSMTDLADPGAGAAALVNGCLIEACGQTQGASHHPDCHATLYAFSVGAVLDAVDRRRWPLVFTNNLVFGGFNTRGTSYGSIGMMATVDDEPGTASPPARHFVNNFLSGQGVPPASACGTTLSSARSEGLRLVVRAPGTAATVQSNVAEWLRNIFHNGGVACERYAVSEEGIGSDLRGLAFRSNDYVHEMPGRDELSVLHRVALYREARAPIPLDHCVHGLLWTFPACIDTDITASTSYTNSVNVDPLFATTALGALIDAPSLAPLPQFFTKEPALNVGPASPFAPTDFLDAVRNDPSTIGHYEQP